MSVDALVSLGSDAFNNNFDIIIPPFLGEDFGTLNIRTQTVNIPSSGSDTYLRSYKTHEIPLTSPKVLLERSFTVNFTLDENYYEYRKLKLWKNAVMNTYSGIIGDLGVLKVPITVIAFSTSTPDEPVETWIFEGARCTQISDISFDRNGSDPITVDATFAFDRLNDLL